MLIYECLFFAALLFGFPPFADVVRYEVFCYVFLVEGSHVTITTVTDTYSRIYVYNHLSRFLICSVIRL